MGEVFVFGDEDAGLLRLGGGSRDTRSEPSGNRVSTNMLCQIQH